MVNDPLQNPINQFLAALPRLKLHLVKKMGALALIFINENFDKQGFQGAAFEPWKKRVSAKDSSRPVLQDKGILKRSPFISEEDTEHTRITSNTDHSKIHNEGGIINYPSRNVILNYAETGGKLKLSRVRTENQQRGISTIRRGTIGAHATVIPKRQFMGPSPVLDQRIRQMIRTEIPTFFKIIK